MATIRQIAPSNPLSTFSEAQPRAGGVFDLLADTAAEAYRVFDPIVRDEAKRAGEEAGRNQARQQAAGMPSLWGDIDPGTADALDVIRHFEGFREEPYWDVNAHRVGYGSDTVTLADGTVQRVSPATRVTRADAERDLGRRVKLEFGPRAASAVGQDVWRSLAPNQRAALTSITYNYGTLPDRVVTSFKNGPEAVVQAIQGLGADNDGVNRRRRAQEAALFAAAPVERPQPVQMTKASGEQVTQAVSPFFGPYKRIHDAAAGVAYQAEMMNRGGEDLLALSHSHPLDPDGYEGAAGEYIDRVVADAPEEFQADLRASLQGQAQSRRIGIAEERQADIRQRAANATTALVDRYATSYADALATGRMEDASAARDTLRSVLRAREQLPGLSWTASQSSGVLADAERAAQRQQQAAAREWETDVRGRLSMISSAAAEGRHTPDEAILADPRVQGIEGYREAAMRVGLRDNMGSFLKLPPAEQKDVIDQARSEPVREKWEVQGGNLVDAMEDAHAETQRALEDDPIGHMARQFPENGPPPVSMDVSDTQAFQDGLKMRRGYGQMMADEGFVDTPQFFSADEREQFKAMTSRTAPVATRAALAMSFVDAFGADAGRALAEVGADPVLVHVGGLAAAGGDTDVAMEALQGQALMEEGVVTLPSKSVRTRTLDLGIGAALPPAPALQGRLLKTAEAIYAARSKGMEEGDEATVFEGAVQAALGQSTDARGRSVGGVQEVFGAPTLLPPRMAVEDAEAALEQLVPTGRRRREADPAAVTDFEGIGNGAPLYAGEPLTAADLRNAALSPVVNPRTGNVVAGWYTMSILYGGTEHDVTTEGGGTFMFDLDALADARF
jgi:GH24 family phage-related lysozyme (muramidase)